MCQRMSPSARADSAWCLDSTVVSLGLLEVSIEHLLLLGLDLSFVPEVLRGQVACHIEIDQKVKGRSSMILFYFEIA